jgi:DNA-binding XRE family transcriptional regulator
MTVIRTKTPAGEPIVIMSEPEFERLRELAEDAEDIAIVARSRTALAAGAEELLTLDEVDALHAAPTPLAFWRKKRKATAEWLADRTGVDPSAIERLERGESVGDVYLYRKVAEALRLRVEDLIPEKS